MKKIKDIYITKTKWSNMSDYSTGLIYVCEDGTIYEEISTDVMEQTTVSRMTLEEIENLAK